MIENVNKEDLEIITKEHSTGDANLEKLQKKRAEKYLHLLVNSDPEKNIYILEPDDAYCKELSSQISFFGYNVQNCANLHELRGKVQKKTPLLLILHIGFEEIDESQKNQILEIKNLAKFPIPIVFISKTSDINTRLQAVRSGGDAYFSRPLNVGKLVDKMDSLISHPVPDPFRILVVDDNLLTASYYSVLLQNAGMLTTVVTDPFQVMHTIVEFKPDLILLDLYMEGCTGIELASILRQQDAYVGIPIVYLSAEEDKEKQIEAMRFGADDFFSKTIPPEYIVSSINLRAERSRNLRSFMVKDSLTGLFNHTQIKETIDIEIARAKRQSSPVSFVMIDLDNFKSINDTYGHLTGDRVIKSLARLLHQRLRKTDIVGRYGGEEFAVILPNTNPSSAFKVIDEIRKSFSQILHQSGKDDFYSTFSFGLSCYPICKNSVDLTNTADQALYKAKRSGKNQGFRDEFVPDEIII